MDESEEVGGLRRDQLHVVVITRININLHGIAEHARPQDRRRLAARLDLFERWAVPSIAWQSEPADSWLILVDASTETVDQARIQRAVAGLPAKIVLLPSVFTLPEFYSTLNAAISTDRPWVLTCRLDSDDALGRTYLASATAAAVGHPGEFLNFARGFKLSGSHLARVTDGSSPFLAFVEPRSSVLRTAYLAPHNRAAEFAPVRQVNRSEAWLMLVHEENWMTRMSGHPVPLAALGAEFPLKRLRLRLRACSNAVRQRTIDRRRIQRLRIRREEGGGQL